MSIPVDLDRLAETLTDRPLGYVITVGGDFHAHAVAVDARLEDDEFTIATAGRTTRRNAGEHPQVTLLWPPPEPGGYSLIVDGQARVDATGLHVVPSRAVLHRPAASGDAPPEGPAVSGCGDDCVPLA